MAYTIKELTKISGMSERTLRFYDEIGLLKPAYYGNNHYRYYEDEQILTLQKILFYRELKFSLKNIPTMVAGSDFEKIELLILHKQKLQQNMSQTHQLIKIVEQTITYLKGKIDDKTFFDEPAHAFAFNSFVRAFEPGNEQLLDQYFTSDLIMYNHAMAKQLNLQDLKLRLPAIYSIFKNLKSEVMDVIRDENKMVFRVEQNARFYKHDPKGTDVRLNVMNLYKLTRGRIKEWQIWVNIIEKS